MRFVTTASFKRDYKKLTAAEQQGFKEAIRKFNKACDKHGTAGAKIDWPKSLRVKALEGVPGIWEMTWSFSGPDGRATWEWCTVNMSGKDFPAIRWRRIGNHSIFKKP